MDIWERCTNCYKHPFCEKISSPTGWCEDWRKKTTNNDLKLESVDGLKFNFKEV